MTPFFRLTFPKAKKSFPPVGGEGGGGQKKSNISADEIACLLFPNFGLHANAESLIHELALWLLLIFIVALAVADSGKAPPGPGYCCTNTHPNLILR